MPPVLERTLDNRQCLDEQYVRALHRMHRSYCGMCLAVARHIEGQQDRCIQGRRFSINRQKPFVVVTHEPALQIASVLASSPNVERLLQVALRFPTRAAAVLQLLKATTKRLLDRGSGSSLPPRFCHLEIADVGVRSNDAQFQSHCIDTVLVIACVCVFSLSSSVLPRFAAINRRTNSSWLS